MTPAEIMRIRAAIPVLQETLYLNTGTSGLPAMPVVDSLLELTRFSELGGLPAYHEVQAQATQARDRLARFLGADPSEVAFTRNATDSLNIAFSLPWEQWRPSPGQPVDVLISDHEYPTCNMIFHYLEQTGRANLIRYALSADTEEMIASLNHHVTDGTKLVVASHVCCNTGLRADVQAVSLWAKERGIISYIDGAQAAGQFPIDLHEIGCDLYITNGHKWLYGPNGVGLLFVKQGFEEHLEPATVGSGTIIFDIPVKWTDGAHRFDLTATRPVQALAAMNAALDWFEKVGVSAIEARQRQLADYVKERILSEEDRYRLICPLSWEQSSSMATFQIRGKTGDEIAAFCHQMFVERKAVLRPVPEFDGIRLSMAYYNVEEEYERFFRLLEDEFC